MRISSDRLAARLERAVEKGLTDKTDQNALSGVKSRETLIDRGGQDDSRKPEDDSVNSDYSELQTLFKIALQLQRQISAETLAQGILEILAEDMDFESGAIYLAQKYGSRLKPIAKTGRFIKSNNAATYESATGILPGTSITTWVAQTGQAVCMGDVRQDPRYQATLDEIRSALCVPMRSAGHLIGVIVLESTEIDAFDEDDQVFLEAVASQLAVAIDNAQLSSELKMLAAKKDGDSGPLNENQETIILELQQQNEELAQINATLLAHNQELNAFSHTVAHDLKNPLAILLGFAEVLSQDYVGGEDTLLSQGIQVIVENAFRMENIIDELLLLAEVRQLDEIDLVPLDMAKIISETCKRLANLIDETEASITVPEAWPMAMGHRPWVQEIWVNYLGNALKYGGRPPEIELGAIVQNDGLVRFWVRDNGIGISKEDQRRLFAPFTKLYEMRAQGHGLGLSIVRRIATRLGGEVGVESQPGEGSLFWFTLPAAVEQTTFKQ